MLRAARGLLPLRELRRDAGKHNLDTGKPIRNDFDFANYLLEEAHVGVVHGAAFGASPYVRIAYAVDLTILREACTRIERACARLVTEELA